MMETIILSYNLSFSKVLHEPTEAQYNALLIAYGKDNGKGKATDDPSDQVSSDYKPNSGYTEKRCVLP